MTLDSYKLICLGLIIPIVVIAVVAFNDPWRPPGSFKVTSVPSLAERRRSFVDRVNLVYLAADVNIVLSNRELYPDALFVESARAANARFRASVMRVFDRELHELGYRHVLFRSDAPDYVTAVEEMVL